MAKDPTLPTMLVIGSVRFRAGTKVETAQAAIDRLADRYRKLDQIVWAMRKFSDRLPQDIREQIAKL